MWAIGIVVLIVVVALVTGYRHQIDNQLRSWKVLPEPEKLTELYFTDPNSLPTKYVPGQTQDVKFTVHNIEYQTETYHYIIYESNESGSQTQQLVSSAFVLGQNQYKNEAVSIPTADLGSRVKVEVYLSNVNESVDYWMNKETT